MSKTNVYLSDLLIDTRDRTKYTEYDEAFVWRYIKSLFKRRDATIDKKKTRFSKMITRYFSKRNPNVYAILEYIHEDESDLFDISRPSTESARDISRPLKGETIRYIDDPDTIRCINFPDDVVTILQSFMYNPNLRDVEKLESYTIDTRRCTRLHKEVYKITLRKHIERIVGYELTTSPLKPKKPQPKTLMSRNVIRVIF